MPGQSQWLLRVPEIRAELEQLSVPVVDRAIFEKVFRVGRRRAHQLMHRFGGYQSGRTFLIERNALLGQLKRVEEGDDFACERQRKERLSGKLEKIRQHSAAAKVHVRVAPEVMSTRIANLPEGVELSPGQLRISFQTHEQLLERLFALAQALANDFEKLQSVLTV